MPRLLLHLALLLPGLACAADYPFSYRRVQVADGVHAFVEPYGNAVVSGNALAIIGNDSVAVIDTGHHPRLTRAIIGEIRALTPKPVRYVVNTHWHNDHVSGNAIYAAAFPGATIVGHAFTARVMDRDVRAFQGPNCVPYLKSQSQPLRDMLASGKAADGTALAEPRRKRLAAFVADADAALEDCGEFRYRGIDLTFEDRITLRLGGRDVELMHLGRANTAGDIVAWVPDVKVLATGDIVVHPFPFTTHGYISEWAAVLRRIEAMPFAALVPGHGPVMRDRVYVAQLADVLESVMSQARAAHAAGKRLQDLRATLDLRALRERFVGSDAGIGANFDYNVGDNAVKRAWQELTGSLEPEGLPDPH